MNLQERIDNKIKQIAKMEKNLKKYAAEETAEFIAMCDRYFESHDFTELKNYKIANGLSFLGDYYSKRHDLEDAKLTLAKYQQQLIKENNKIATLSDMPEVLKQFRDRTIAAWDAYDISFRERLKVEIRKASGDRKAYDELYRKYGYHFRDTAYQSDEDIHKENVKAGENLVLNLLNQTLDICGKITDCAGLSLNQSNEGFTIINGLVIGENGKARVESILAGGYNIQRLHVRVLVKEVK